MDAHQLDGDEKTRMRGRLSLTRTDGLTPLSHGGVGIDGRLMADRKSLEPAQRWNVDTKEDVYHPLS